jgi:hypothetical protein
MAAGLATHAAGALAGARTLPRIASELGSSRTLEEAGSVLQDEAQNWRNTVMPQSINEAAAPLDAMIPGEAVSAAGNFGTGLSDLISKGGSSANAVRYFLDTTEASKGALGQTANRMNDWLKASRIGLAGAPEAPTMTWAEMRDFRTELGQHMRTARENEKPALERIYGGLTQDMGGLAQQYGAGDQFARFNIVSTLAHQLDAGPIEKILSAQQPGDAAARLLAGARRGGETLETLRGVLPTGVNELAAAHLNMNPDARAWARLAPEGQSALVPQAADRSIIERTGPVKGDPGIGTKMLESLVGGAVTGAGARILGQALVPGMNPLVTEAAGELVGNAMPFAWRGMVGTVRHPALTLTGGLAGGIGGTLP